MAACRLLSLLALAGVSRAQYTPPAASEVISSVKSLSSGASSLAKDTNNVAASLKAWSSRTQVQRAETNEKILKAEGSKAEDIQRLTDQVKAQTEAALAGIAGAKEKIETAQAKATREIEVINTDKETVTSGYRDDLEKTKTTTREDTFKVKTDSRKTVVAADQKTIMLQADIANTQLKGQQDVESTLKIGMLKLPQAVEEAKLAAEQSAAAAIDSAVAQAKAEAAPITERLMEEHSKAVTDAQPYMKQNAEMKVALGQAKADVDQALDSTFNNIINAFPADIQAVTMESDL